MLKPIEGASTGGINGFFVGIGQGAIGSLTKPTGSILAVSQTIMKNATASTKIFARKRTPRAIFGDHLLRRFDLENAAAYYGLEQEVRRLRNNSNGNLVAADQLQNMMHSFFGFAKSVTPAGCGLVVTFEMLNVIDIKTFSIQQQIPISTIKHVCLGGDDQIEITILGHDNSKVMGVRLASPSKAIIIHKILNQLMDKSQIKGARLVQV